MEIIQLEIDLEPIDNLRGRGIPLAPQIDLAAPIPALPCIGQEAQIGKVLVEQVRFHAMDHSQVVPLGQLFQCGQGAQQGFGRFQVTDIQIHHRACHGQTDFASSMSWSACPWRWASSMG